MLNHKFLTCAKAEIKDLTVCIVVWKKISKSRCDIDLDRRMPNAQDGNTDKSADGDEYSIDEYSIVVVDTSFRYKMHYGSCLVKIFKHNQSSGNKPNIKQANTKTIFSIF